MAQRRSRLVRPLQQLEQARHPFYIVWHGRVVFANAACAEWLGLSSDELSGTLLVVPEGSPPDADVAMANAALAPPARAFREPGAYSFRIVLPGRAERLAHAVAFPLADSDECAVWVWAMEELSRADDRGVRQHEVEASRLHAEVMALTFRFGREIPPALMGRSALATRARRQLDTIARSPAATLIHGPAGIGREAVCRYLQHRAIALNPKLEGELYPIACPLMDASLMSSSLDLVAEQLASGDVVWLMLLEVDQLASDAQTVLRHRLEDMDQDRVIIISTSRSRIDEQADSGPDLELARRLVVFEVSLPGLAARRGDIAQMAQGVLERYCLEHGVLLEGFTSSALDRMASYEWPENVAELEEVVAQAAEAATAPLIDATELPRLFDWADDAAVHRKRELEPIDLDSLLAEVEREVVARAYRATRGNKTQVARLLGVSRQRVIRLIKEWGLDEPLDEGED